MDLRYRKQPLCTLSRNHCCHLLLMLLLYGNKSRGGLHFPPMLMSNADVIVWRSGEQLKNAFCNSILARNGPKIKRKSSLFAQRPSLDGVRMTLCVVSRAGGQLWEEKRHIALTELNRGAVPTTNDALSHFRLRPTAKKGLVVITTAGF